MVLLLLPVATGFVVGSAFGAGVIEVDGKRVAFGLARSAVALPLLLGWRLRAFLASRRRQLALPSFGTFVAVCNVALVGLVALGFADDTGRALRRRGDWFLGERNGWVTRQLRGAIDRGAGYLEHFDPPPELAPLLIPADPRDTAFGPFRPGEEPPAPSPRLVQWFHPLAGPRRALPLSAGRRFGADRPQPRPAECDLGHCGVDLGTTLGEPVFAGFRRRRREDRARRQRRGRAGRYIRIGHKEGTVVSRYIHLDTIAAALKEGDHVTGGELIGRVGQSGVRNSGPHLHFGLSLRPGGRSGNETYIDPSRCCGAGSW